jgi:hypothetical protein
MSRDSRHSNVVTKPSTMIQKCILLTLSVSSPEDLKLKPSPDGLETAAHRINHVLPCAAHNPFPSCCSFGTSKPATPNT